MGNAPGRCEFTPADVTIVLSAHGIERFRDRVRPALDLPHAEQELRELIAHGQVCSDPPGWVAERQRQRAAFYLLVGDCVFPMDPSRVEPTSLCILTCLTPGDLSPSARSRRNSRRRSRSQRR